VPAAGLAALLVELVQHPKSSKGGPAMTDPLERMVDVVDRDMQAQVNGQRRGEVSTFSCPECGGPLWQVDEPGVLRFRCHVGHAYYGDALLEEQSAALEAALWTAVRTFREKAVLARQLAAGEQQRGNAAVAQRFHEQATLA